MLWASVAHARARRAEDAFLGTKQNPQPHSWTRVPTRHPPALPDGACCLGDLFRLFCFPKLLPPQHPVLFPLQVSLWR